MRSNHLTISICVAAIFVLANGPLLPQQMKAANDVMHTIHQPYGVETFGEFRRIMMGGDFTPKVRLGAAMAKHPTTGVGALADARGEITIYDGKLIVSYGKGGASADANSESAALLAMGSAAEWQSVRVEQDVAPEEIEVLHRHRRKDARYRSGGIVSVRGERNHRTLHDARQHGTNWR